VRPGDRVLASVTPACGTCWRCVNGMSNHCELNPAVKAGLRFELGSGQRAAAVLDLGSMISHRIKLEQINDGLALLTRSEGTRTVVL